MFIYNSIVVNLLVGSAVLYAFLLGDVCSICFKLSKGVATQF